MPEPTVADKRLIEQIFDGAAPTYDKVGPSFFRDFGANLVGKMKIAPGARVLDVGTGTGAVLIPAAGAVGPNGQVVGIDLSNEMLGEADRAARLAGVEVQLGKMDVEALEFADQSFDAVLFGFSLFFCGSMERGLEQAHRVLASGGKLGLSMWSKSPPPFAPAWKLFADMVRSYGVEVRMPQKVAFVPEEVIDLLSRTGYERVDISLEAHQLSFASDEEWWTFQMTNGSRAAILRMPEEKRVQFKNEYFSRLHALAGKAELVFPVTVIYAIATKAGS